jgi:hypothetical protein
MTGYWAGMPISKKPLSQINGTGYCYRIQPLFLRIQALEGSERFEYFRGVWPVGWSSASIQHAMIFPKCTAGVVQPL